MTIHSETNFDTTEIRAGSAGQLWAGLTVPPPGTLLLLHSDGTPDATTNPFAKHLGMTKEGSVATFEVATTDFFADEFPSPIKTTVDQVNARIEGALLQVFDFDILEILTPGFGTKASAKAITFGTRPLLYTSVALIFPQESDPTKFAVVQLYDAINVGGLAIAVGRKTMTEIPINFKARTIAQRVPATDAMGSFYIQPAGPVFAAGGLFSWIAPVGVTSVTIDAFGAGGGGGGGNTGQYGGGGGAGGHATKVVAVVPGTSYPVNVGLGGAGMVADGSTGGDSWFSTAGTVKGAGGGGGGFEVTGGNGGAGGAGIGDTVVNGADGHSGAVSDGAGGAGAFGAGGHGGLGIGGNGSPGAVKISY